MFQYTLTIWIELICFFISLFFLRSEQVWWKHFTWFMLITVVTEATGFYAFFYWKPGISNEWIYNLYLPLEMGFIALALYRILRHYGIKAIYFIAAFAVFVFIYLYESIRTQFVAYSSISNTYASVMIIIACCTFYYWLLKANEHVDLPVYAPFWIVSGLFIFYFGSTGVNSFISQLSRIYETTGIPVRFIIMVVLNFILYACWSYAFICRNRNKILL